MPVNIDIIILSYAKNEHLKGLTVQAIDTLMASEDSEKIHFNVVVIESNSAIQPYQFEGATTIYPNKKFGFNKFLNIGINATSNKYLCLCNNDLIFHKGWATEMLSFAGGFADGLIVASPYCEKSHTNFKDEVLPIQKYFGCFAGHCFFTTRETLKVVGELDEKINFWFADSDFIELMEHYKIPHYLLPKSKVDHINAQATSHLSDLDRLRYTYYPYIYFQYKWKGKNIFTYGIRLMKYYLKYAACVVTGITGKEH